MRRAARLAPVIALGALVLLSATACGQDTSAAAFKPRPATTAQVGVPPTPFASPTPRPTEVPTPPPPPPVFFVKITSSDYGFVGASTFAGASCSVSVNIPNGNPVSPGGPQNADGNGNVSWTYQQVPQPPATTGGTWSGTHAVTCSQGGQSVTASAPFTLAA